MIEGLIMITINLVLQYFVIKWAVKSAIEDSQNEIGKAVNKGTQEIKHYVEQISEKDT